MSDLGKIDEFESSKSHTKILEKEWENRSRGNYTHPLLKSIFKCYKWKILQIIISAWINTIMELVSIFILKGILDYIEGKSDNFNWTILFVVLFVAIENGIVFYMIQINYFN